MSLPPAKFKLPQQLVKNPANIKLPATYIPQSYSRTTLQQNFSTNDYFQTPQWL